MGASEELGKIVDAEVKERIVRDIAETLRKHFEEGKGPGGLRIKIHDPVAIMQEIGILTVRSDDTYDYYEFPGEARTWYERLKAEGFYENPRDH